MKTARRIEILRTVEVACLETTSVNNREIIERSS